MSRVDCALTGDRRRYFLPAAALPQVMEAADTTESCKALCAADGSCRWFTYNERTHACFLTHSCDPQRLRPGPHMSENVGGSSPTSSRHQDYGAKEVQAPRKALKRSPCPDSSTATSGNSTSAGDCEPACHTRWVPVSMYIALWLGLPPFMRPLLEYAMIGLDFACGS
eukprot:jgi/Tetstr1/464561/TSEL_009317.t1